MMPQEKYGEAERERLRDALQKISASICCLGPGCPYCESDEPKHPPTWEAKIAIEALRADGR